MNIDKIIDKAVENKEVAGLNVLVRQNGKEVYYHEAGYANLESKKPYTRDALVRLYSMSKPITAAAIMLLMERGEITLNQKVDTIIPGFKDMLVEENGKFVLARGRINIKQLLGMTSGLPYDGNMSSQASVWATKVFKEIDEKLETSEEISTMDFANKISKGPLDFHPGEGWEYGTSADILGAVVEKVSGMPFSEFLDKELFKPLGMNETGFYVSKENASRLVDCYERRDGQLIYCPTRHLGMTYERTNKPKFESGGAGLVSSIDDYAKFAQMLLDGGSANGKQILSEKTVEFFTNPHMSPCQQNEMWRTWYDLLGYNYGHLLRYCVDPNMAAVNTFKGEYGWDGWLGTFFGNCKENESTILITYQIKNAGEFPLNERIRNAIYQEIL